MKGINPPHNQVGPIKRSVNMVSVLSLRAVLVVTLSGVLAMAMAARNCGGKVIAQVKRVVARESLHPQMVRVPGILVDAIVIDENQKLTTGIRIDPAASGQTRKPWHSISMPPLTGMRRAYSGSLVNSIRGNHEMNGFIRGFAVAIVPLALGCSSGAPVSQVAVIELKRASDQPADGMEPLRLYGTERDVYVADHRRR